MSAPRFETYDFCCYAPEGCVCGAQERGLRAIIAGNGTRPMTAEQRAWCVSEVASVEGFSEQDCVGLDDVALANLVLSAWLDYARDKGLA